MMRRGESVPWRQFCYSRSNKSLLLSISLYLCINDFLGKRQKMRSRQDSNLQSSVQETDALSIRPQDHALRQPATRLVPCCRCKVRRVFVKVKTTSKMLSDQQQIYLFERTIILGGNDQQEHNKQHYGGFDGENLCSLADCADLLYLTKNLFTFLNHC